LIKDYNLQDYTLVALGRKVMDDGTQITALNGVKKDPASYQEIAPVESQRVYPEGVFKINRTSVVFVPKGVSYLALAERHRIALHRLFEFNDMVEAEATLTDRLVYLQRKRREGATDFHTVVQGETIYDIAQVEGIQLESLLSYNYLRSDVNPTPGRKLYLTKDAAKDEGKHAVSSGSIIEKQLQDAKESFVLHTVQVKQSLYAIAKMYQVKVDELREWNGIEGDGLKTGQQLRINKK
jgi:LysM repeat protein